LASQERLDNLIKKQNDVVVLKEYLQKENIEPLEANAFLESVNSSALLNKQKAAQLLLRPGVDLKSMINNIPSIQPFLNKFEYDSLEQVEIQLKYETYIEKEKEMVQKMSQLENLIIPDNFNYDNLVSLSNEARQKFNKIKPKTLGQASRISGVNPSDVQILLLFMGR
jgi:tRNA uridine 5-carboxymethylaminomethyl modification enzyme